jgi:hypothetical protein
MTETILKIMNRAINKYEVWALVLIVLWAIYYLSDLLMTGFISDDAYNSQIKGEILLDNLSILDRIWHEVRGWIMGAGRIMVLNWYMTYGVYYLTQSELIIKSINLIIILIGLIFFYFFTKNETKSSNIAFFACLIFPVFVQFRLWHDPVLAFTFLIPIIFALTVVALVSFQKYLDSGNQRYYFLSIATYLLPLLMYEISYTLCFLFPIVAYFRSQNILKSIKQSLPFTLLTAFFICISITIKYNLVENSYPGANLHVEFSKLITAFNIQTFSSFPLSYYYFNKENLVKKLYAIDYVSLLLFWVALTAIIYKLGKSPNIHKLSSWIASGIILLLIPSALTALSGHQIELNQMGFGYGYIPVYIQYFGAVILLVSLVYFILSKINKGWYIFFTIFLSSTITIVAAKNLKLNRAVAMKSNETYLHPRKLLQSALEAGIANDLTGESFLFRTMRFPSDYSRFYAQVTGKKFDICELSDSNKYSICISKILSEGHVHAPQNSQKNNKVEFLDLRKQSAWILSYNFDKKTGESGRLYLGKIDNILQNKVSKNPIQIHVSQLKTFDLNDNNISNFNLDGSPINFLKLINQQTLDISEVKEFEPSSFKVDDVDFEWIGDIYPLEGTSSNNLRWSSGSATLVLHNFTSKSKSINIAMGLATPTHPSSEMIVYSFGQTEKYKLSSSQINYSKKLILPPGQSIINFQSNANPIKNGDPRNIVFGFFNFIISTEND